VWERGYVYTGFWWGTLREGNHLEDPGEDWSKILNGSQGSGMWGMEWIGQPQVSDWWLALVNAVLKLRVP
jgi:hypothetical protein